MTTTTDLDLAHAAFERREWTAAARAFAAADRATELGAADLAMAGLAFHLIGEEDVAQSLIVRAHHAGVAAVEAPFAARMAFYLGMMSADRGDIAVAGGWISRSHLILDESGADTVERVYLL